MTHTTQSEEGFDSQKSSFLVTPKLIRILKALEGVKFNLNEIPAVNSGIIDLIIGVVIAENNTQNNEEFEQVIVQTATGRKVELTSNPDRFEKNLQIEILESIRNEEFFNQPKIISIKNLNAFKWQFHDAARFRLKVSCVLNKETSKILLLSLHSQMNTGQSGSSGDSHQAQDISQISPLPIEFDFLGEFSTSQKDLFNLAADFWGKIINDSLPIATVNGQRIKGLKITVVSSQIDGLKNILGQSNVVHLRPGTLLPATGIIEFDTADLINLETEGVLLDTIIHEIGHVLGFGTLWEQLKLVEGIETENPQFIGENAMQEYAKLLGSGKPVPVPLENTGGPGTQNVHWRESVFGNELMTGFVGLNNPISRLTIAAFKDMGYQTNLNTANFFVLSENKQQISIVKSPEKFQSPCNCSIHKNKLILLPKSLIIDE